MRIDDVPERLVILGGGYIAAEFAHVFSAFGATVSVIGRSALLLRKPRRDGAPNAFTRLALDRWDVHLGQRRHGRRQDAIGSW